MADDSISLQDFISGSYGSQGVPKEQQQGYISQLKQYFPSGQIPKSALPAAYGLLGTALPGSGSSFVGGTSNPTVSGGDNSQRQMYGAILSAVGQGGGGGGGGQQQAAMGTGVDPQNYLGNLGALAMRRVMGTGQIPVVGNPQPQSGDLSQGGISNVPSPTYSDPSNQALQQSLFGGTGREGKVNATPGVFSAAPTARPTQPWAYNPTPQATGAQPQGQPAAFAQPPAAPTAQTAGIGLAGPPSAPTPNQLGDWTQMPNGQWQHAGGMISGQPKGGLQPMGMNQVMQLALGQPTNTAMQSGLPKRMQSGGWVTGQGDDDNQLTLLQPGEYVLNRRQASRLNLPDVTQSGMGEGESVARSRLPATVGDYMAQQPRQMQTPQQTTQAQGLQPGITPQEAEQAGRTQQDPFGAGGTFDATRFGGPGQTVGSYANAYQAGLTQQDPFGPGGSYDVTGGGAGAGGAAAAGGGMGSALAGGISGIGSALQQAFKGPGPWKPIPRAFGGPSGYAQATPTFRREEII
jgi:hypothetical protein